MPKQSNCESTIPLEALSMIFWKKEITSLKHKHVIYVERFRFGIQWNENSLRGKNKDTVILKTGRFDNIDSAVIISIVSKTESITLSYSRSYAILAILVPYLW